MTVGIQSSGEPTSDRAERIRACRLFNGKYSEGIESPRRADLLKTLRKALPLFERIILEAKAVADGERERFAQAVDRMAESEGIFPADDLVADPVTQRIWDCCEEIGYEVGRECPFCGEETRPSSCLEDDAAIIRELIACLDTPAQDDGESPDDGVRPGDRGHPVSGREPLTLF